MEENDRLEEYLFLSWYDYIKNRDGREEWVEYYFNFNHNELSNSFIRKLTRVLEEDSKVVSYKLDKTCMKLKVYFSDIEGYLSEDIPY